MGKFFSFWTTIFTLLAVTSVAEARRAGYSYLSIATQSHHYTDILNETSQVGQELSPDTSINIDIRLYRLFSLMLIGGHSWDDTQSFFGLGFRTDLPGFFFIGGNVNDLIHRKRRKGTTTYFSYQNLILRQKGQASSLVGSRFALGMDFDINDDWYWNLEPAIYSQEGNRHFSLGLGLGIEF